MMWADLLLLAQNATHDLVLGTSILGGVGAAFAALWTMIRQNAKLAERREGLMGKAIGEMEAGNAAR
jgi:hypothetical protein